MKAIQRLQFVIILTLLFSVALAAKCPTGSVTVHGRVENLPSTVNGAEATVLVETPKGAISRTASVSNREFAVDVPFSTYRSTLLGGDHCDNLPRSVEVKIVAVGKIYVQKKLDFKENFEAIGSYQYRLKEQLSLDVPKERADGAK